MDLLQGTEFCQEVLYVLKTFVSAYEPLIKSWFDIPMTEMPISVLFVSDGVLFDGAFFPVNILKKQEFKKYEAKIQEELINISETLPGWD